ncbi:MAG: excinuclease ABC subunit UvrC [Gemmatimonadetes bacterium]|nr:excinuclease ABC subunit UvrC [Gemmatimonadota bacterium]
MSRSVDPTPLHAKLRHLPTRPGVYLLKGSGGEILYIGKAKSLRARVKSHFAQDASASPKSQEMLRRVADVDTLVVGSEAEALLLEANLIKAHRPRFNIQLRDDKRYPYIKVTAQEPFPRVFVTRLLQNDGARYFGPFTEVGAMRQALELIKRRYTVRSCRYDLPREAPTRPCLDYHLGRCQAPCVGLQSGAAYRVMIDEILEVLGGRIERVGARVEEEMRAAAGALDFERAATLRDVLGGLQAIEQRQRALDLRGGDQDVFGVARDGDRGCVVLLRIRSGKLLGREAEFFVNLGGEADGTVLAAGVSRLYFGRGGHGTADLPREALFPQEFEDRGTVEELLSGAAGRRVRTRLPQKGDKLRLTALASQNARHLLEERVVLEDGAPERADDVLYELQERLELKVVPRLIVCFDISHMQGSDVVGSAVVFRNGEPDKSEYRHFRLRGEWGNDDFRSLAEVVSRYFRRRLQEGSPLPELAVIDGGKGQLGAALRAGEEVGARDVAFCALAKREEEVYLTGRPLPLHLPRTNPALRLLQRVRNEAHRFAHGYNRKLRRRHTLASELAEIPGIGAVRRKRLLERFGSVRALRSAEAAQVAELPGFSAKLAQQVIEHLGRDAW